MAIARHSINLLNRSHRFFPFIVEAKRFPGLPIVPSLPPQHNSSRMFTTSSVLSKEQIEELQKNPFFDKYADKIAKLQKTNPEEFLSRLEAKGKQDAPAKPKDFFLPTTAKATGSASGSPQEKKLEKLMKLELLADKTPQEIETIWTQHFSTKDAVAAAIPRETYSVMEERFRQFNTFLFPLPRDQGYEFIVVQFLGREAHFSTLINYQAHKENAPECLSMVHYTELADEKGLVLMVGEYDKDVLSVGEARSLVVQTVLYYGLAREEDKKWAHLYRFTHITDEFNHLDLIAELELAGGFPAPA